MTDEQRTKRLIRRVRLVIWSFPVWLFLYVLWQNYAVEVEAVVTREARGPRVVRSFLLAVFEQQSRPVVSRLTGGLGRERNSGVLRARALDVPTDALSSIVKVRLVATPNGRPYRIQALVDGAGEPTAIGDPFLVDGKLNVLQRSWSSTRNDQFVLWQRPTAGGGRKPLGAESSRHSFFGSEALAKSNGERSTASTVSVARFASVEQFLDNLPPPESIVTANLSLDPYYRIPDYQPSTSWYELPRRIRGAHVLYTYLEDEDLDFSFTFQDINRHRGADPVRVTVSSASGFFLERFVEDDGVTVASGEVRLPRSLHVLMPRPPRGVYRIEIEAHDDVFTTELRTRQHHLVFAGHLYLTDNVEYVSLLGRGPFLPTTLVTDATTLSVRTAHPLGFQRVRVGDKTLNVRTTHTFVSRRGLRGLTEIVIPRNDLYLEGGLFAFTPEQYFNPFPPRIPELETLPSLDGYEFVIGRILPFDQSGDTLIFEQSLTLTGVRRPVGSRLRLTSTDVDSRSPLPVDWVELQAENVALNRPRLKANLSSL